MFRPRRLFLAVVFGVWMVMVLACGGAGTAPVTTDKPDAKTGISGAGTPKTDSWAGKLGTGKLGTGATAYDELPEPWRGRFIGEWKSEVAAWKNEVTAAESKLEKAKAAVMKAQEEMTKFEKKYKEELKVEGFTKQVHKEKKAALAKAESGIGDAEAALLAAKERCAAAEKNDPPFFNKPFAGCKNPRDIEKCLAAIDAQKAADEARQKAEAERRKAEEEYESGGLVLLNKTVEGTTNQFGTDITGTVVNRTGKKFRYAQIKFILYDESDAQIGTALANITDLEAGARWNFKAVAFVKAAKHKVAELTGH